MNKLYTSDILDKISLQELRIILKNEFNGIPKNNKKEDIIKQIIDEQTALMLQSENKKKHKESKDREKSEFDVFFESHCFRDSGSNDADIYEGTNPKDIKRGIIEIMAEGFAFLRMKKYSNTSDDIFVSKTNLRYYDLRQGDFVECTCEQLKETGAPALKQVFTVNGVRFNSNIVRKNFDKLLPHYPDKKFILERKDMPKDYSIRCIDLFCPIGKGQRGLIVASPKVGKTTLLKKIACSLNENYPEAHVVTLLIDERPEEVTDIMDSVRGEVVYSTFDDSPEHHVKVAEMVIGRAKRLVEMGEDVVILLDSLTRLTRAYNAIISPSGKTLTGGIDPMALVQPKKFFGAARNIKDSGSLTIIATVLIDTGSKMDDVIYEEFKGTSNMEIYLSRELSERRIFPAIDLFKSSTRNEHLLLSQEEYDCICELRKLFSEDKKASENMLEMMSKTRDNEEFIKLVPKWLNLSFKPTK